MSFGFGCFRCWKVFRRGERVYLDNSWSSLSSWMQLKIILVAILFHFICTQTYRDIPHPSSKRPQMLANSDSSPFSFSSPYNTSSCSHPHSKSFLLPFMRPNNLRIKPRKMVIDGTLLRLARFLQSKHISNFPLPLRFIEEDVNIPSHPYKSAIVVPMQRILKVEGKHISL